MSIDQMIIQAVVVVLSFLAGGFLERYREQIRKGKLKILTVRFCPEGGKGSYIEAVMVNTGKEHIIIDWVLLRDKNNRKFRTRPALKRDKESTALWGYGVPRNLGSLERCSVSFHLHTLLAEDIELKEIVAFEAVDTLEKVYKRDLPKEARKQIVEWVDKYNAKITP